MAPSSEGNSGSDGEKTLFTLVAETVPGSEVRVVGSVAALGCWSPDGGVPLARSANGHPRWTASKVIPRSSKDCVEYKFVIVRADGGVDWEDGPNRVLPREPSGRAEPRTPRFRGRAEAAAPRLFKQRCSSTPNLAAVAAEAAREDFSRRTPPSRPEHSVLVAFSVSDLTSSAEVIEVVFETDGKARRLNWDVSTGRWVLDFNELGLRPGVHAFHFLVDGERALSSEHPVFGASNVALLHGPLRRCVMGLGAEAGLNQDVGFRRRATAFDQPTAIRTLPRPLSIGHNLAERDSSEDSDGLDSVIWGRREAEKLPDEVWEGLYDAELRLRLCGHTLDGFLWSTGLANPLRLQVGAHQVKKESGAVCEDAYFMGAYGLGVADGVGSMVQYARYGVDAAKYARELMVHASASLDGSREADPTERAVQACGAAERLATGYGAATFCSLALSNRTIGIANLGDSGYMVLRRAKGGMEIVYRSEEQHHSWNCPFQLTRLPPALARFLVREDHAGDCNKYTHEVREGDLVLLFSDGLHDNLHDAEVISIVDRALPPAFADLLGLPERHTAAAHVARALTLAARARSQDPRARVPFGVYSRRNGYEWEGGKDDDITVVAAWVVPDRGSDTSSTAEGARPTMPAGSGLAARLYQFMRLLVRLINTTVAGSCIRRRA